MGVKGLWKYFEKHGLISTLPGKIRESEECLYADILHPDHLFIDMNSMIHAAYTRSAKPVTTQSTITELISMLHRLLSKIQPERTLVVVIDGVAPLAKLATQRDRRSNLPAKQPPEPQTTLPAKSKRKNCTENAKEHQETHKNKHVERSHHVNVGKELLQQEEEEEEVEMSTTNNNMYTCDILSSPVPLAREEIVTGSEFVHACAARIIRWLDQRHTRLTEHKKEAVLLQHEEWKQKEEHQPLSSSSNSNNIKLQSNKHKVYDLIVSDYMEEGEGEIKIAQILRHLWRRRVWSERCCANYRQGYKNTHNSKDICSNVQKSSSNNQHNTINNNNNNNDSYPTETNDISCSIDNKLNVIEYASHCLNDSIVIVGNDSDLALVAMLALPFRTFTILDAEDYQILTLDKLPEHWLHMSLSPKSMQLSQNKKRDAEGYSRFCSFRVDWSFIMLLAGCDYYTGLADKVLTLWSQYRELRSSPNAFEKTSLITMNNEGNACELNVEFMRAIINNSIMITSSNYRGSSNGCYGGNSSSRSYNSCINYHKGKKGARNGKGKGFNRRVSNKEKLERALEKESSSGRQSAQKGLFVLRGALILLESYLRGRAVDFMIHNEHSNELQHKSTDNNKTSEVNNSNSTSSNNNNNSSNSNYSVCSVESQRQNVSFESLRAALQLHNVSAKLSITESRVYPSQSLLRKQSPCEREQHSILSQIQYNEEQNNNDEHAIFHNECASQSTILTETRSASLSQYTKNNNSNVPNIDNHCKKLKETNCPENNLVLEHVTSRHTLCSPFAQCLAILGIRGRYSTEARRVIAACTSDNGIRLTTTNSMSFVQKMVGVICNQLEVEKVTRAEAEMLQHSFTYIRALYDDNSKDNNDNETISDNSNGDISKNNEVANSSYKCYQNELEYLRLI